MSETDETQHSDAKLPGKSGTSALAYWLTAPGEGELRSETLAEGLQGELKDGYVRVKTLASAVSRGTEALVHSGMVPKSEYERMRAPMQSGEFPFPVKYGYMAVGEVIRGPESLRGERVFCLHPHQSEFIVPEEALTCIPPGVSTRRATLAANMETAVNIHWDAGLTVGDRAVVVGAGVVGCLTAWIAASVRGVRVTLVDIEPSRADVAECLGVRFSTPDRLGSCRGADVVVHASGTASGLASALDVAGEEATVVEASWHGDRPVPIPLGKAFHSRRLKLVSSQVGTIPPSRARRWTHAKRLRLALDLLADERLDVLLTSNVPFTSIEEAYPRILADPTELCATFDYSTS